MCAGTAVLDQLTSTTTEMYPMGRYIDQQQRSLILARGSLATCYINARWSTETSLPVTFLYDTYVLLNGNYCLCNWTASPIRNPAAYLLLALVYAASKR